MPVEQTSSTIPHDLVNDIMRRPYRERFRLIVTELGTGLAGRPDDLQEVLRRAHPGLRETSKVLRILGDQNQVIKSFITDSDTVVTELEKNKRDVVRWVREAGDAAEISATRRDELRADFQRFPEFLDELRPTMARLGELADEQTPLLADLQRAAPDLDTFFTRLGPFSEASRPAVRSLGDAGEVGTQAFTEGSQEIAELRTLAAGRARVRQAAAPVPPDARRPQARDRERPAREGHRAARAGPDGDPEARAASPASRRSGTTSSGRRSASTCSTTRRTCCARRSPSRRTARSGATSRRRRRRIRRFKRCNSYLGPNQPGIFSPDPLDDGSNPSAARLRAESGKPASSVGEQRGEGQPEAGPLPGQPDLSKPQIVLPPGVQELLDGLTPRERRQLDRDDLEELGVPVDQLGVPVPQVGAPADDQTTGQLLDFLLAP